MSLPVLAVVSPLPPTRTGIADYTARLLPHLAERWHVVVFIADRDPAPTNTPNGIEVLRIGSWDWYRRLVDVDRLLLCLGNSIYHLDIPELSAQYGGVVLAHDIRMTAMHCLRAAADRDRHMLSTLVDGRHGPELAREIRLLEDRAPVSELFVEMRGRLEAANAFLLAGACPGADAVLVHSALAARLARLELGATTTPVLVVPFGHPHPLTATGARAPAVVTSFGMVGPEKHSPLLVEALAWARREVPDVTLRFVGPIELSQQAALERDAIRCGVAGAVHYTGHLDGRRYREELALATVAAQLRAVVNGEASAAVADCLAAGIPTVVTHAGAQADLPNDAVVAMRPLALASDVGHELAQLLCDQPRRDSLSAAGRAYAASSSFGIAADAISGALEAAPPPRP